MKKLIALVSLVGWAVGFPAQAASINPSLDDTLQLRVGPFLADIDSSVRVAGTDFDVEDRLDDSKTTFAAFGRWRVTPRLHINFGYSSVDRSESETLGAAVPIGGLTIPGGTRLETSFETSSLSAGLAYALVKSQTTEFGLDAGVAFTTIKDSVRTTVPGAPTVTVLDQDTSEPLPSVGVFINHALSPQWMLAGSFRWLGFEIGDLNADIYDAFAGIEWRPWKNVGLGGAYIYQDFDGTVTGGGTTTDLNFTYQGPFAYVLFGW